MIQPTKLPDFDWTDEEVEPTENNLSDAVLLGRFQSHQDQAAFETLVSRHGPMVHDVCRSILKSPTDADDAFQETFLVLAKKSDSIRNKSAIACWLHGVACRSAQKARVRAATRRKHEHVYEPVHEHAATNPDSSSDDSKWKETLHTTLHELPERFRAPLVLCYLQGVTQQEAAKQLGLAKSTLRARLERGRTQLRSKLLKAGLGPAIMLALAAWPTASASASVPASLVTQTMSAVTTHSAAALYSSKATIGATAYATSFITLAGLATAFALTAFAIMAWQTSASLPKQSTFPLTLTAAQPETDDQKATRLALAAHQQADAISKLPKFEYQTRYRYGVVNSQRAVDATLEMMKKSLVGDVLQKDWIGFYERGFSWDEKQVLYEFRPGETDLSYKYVFGTSNDSWDRSEAKDQKSRSFVRRLGVTEFWDTPSSGAGSSMMLFDFCYLRLTPHRYWWGETVKGRNVHTMFFAKLDEVTWKLLPAESFGEEACDVVEASYPKSGDKAQRLWISQKTGRVRGVVSYFANSHPNELARFDDYREIAPGVWLPFRETRTFPHGSDITVGKQKLFRSELIVDKVSLSRDLSSRLAELMPKEGDQVQDQRFDTALDYEYRKDRSDDELQSVAEKKRKEELKGLEEFHKIIKPLDDLLGNSAPALPAEGWLGGARPEVAGKPYLVHFWATWCAPCKGDLPQLKKFAEEGFTIIGVHPPGTAPEEIERTISDRKLGYPTLLAASDPNSEKTPKLAGYPGGVFPYCILVDAQGNVAAHGLLRDIISSAKSAARLAELSSKPTPPLEASQWFNTKSDLKLDELKGKVVLLDFWGQWCGPCVAKLPAVEDLHTKYKEKGLVVIGIHSHHDSEKLAEFLTAKKVTFPVMIDKGETAERYTIDAWPRYFLLDKSGKPIWGYTHEPPTAEQIEKLLNAEK